jgi:hypothetical protein
MIQLLLSLLVFAVIVGLVFYLLRALPLPAPWNVIVQVLVVLIAILVLAEMLLGGGFAGFAALRR